MNSFMAAASCLAILLLSSCNTAIGLWRDGKEGFQWSKQKIQESQSGDSAGEYEDYNDGAPVY